MNAPRLISEGALGGHIDHLYENPGLTFGEIKQIFQTAASGQLEGTEKVDGQNIFLSYSTSRGARAARNQGDLQGGGMDAKQLGQKFVDPKYPEALQQAFNEAFQAFEAVASGFSPEQIQKIFGEDANIWYSAEVIDPGAANVIDYDSKILNIHRSGPWRVDKSTGKPTGGEEDKENLAGAAAQLDAAISSIENKIQDTHFRVQRSQLTKLKAMTDGSAAQQAMARIDGLGVRDGDTVGEWLLKELQPIVKDKISLPVKKNNMLLQKMLGHKGINKRIIKKGLTDEEKETVDGLIDGAGAILKQKIWPLEGIIHDFAVAALEGMKSLYMLGAQDKKVQSIRDKVSAEVDNIKSTGSGGQLSSLEKHLSKMKYAEKGLKGITSTAEGFVFDFNGHTYKFTGQYAPINQLLGILRYKRGGKEKVSESKIIKEQDPTPPYHGDRDDKLLDQTSEYALWQIMYGSKKYWLITDHNGEMVDEHGTGFGKKRDAMGAWAKFTDADEFKDADEFRDADDWPEQDPSERYLVGKTTIMREEISEGKLSLPEPNLPQTAMPRGGGDVDFKPKSNVQEAPEEKTETGIALVPGGFKPPHAGHYKLAEWAASQPGVDRAIVLVSPKARPPVTAQMAVKIWNIYKNAFGGNFDIQISDVASPVGATYSYVDNKASPGQTVYVIKGEKDAGDKRFGDIKGRKEGVEVKELVAPSFAGGISGTTMRDNYIIKGDAEGFKNALPKGLSEEDKSKIWEIIGGEVSMKEYLVRITQEVLNEAPEIPIRAVGKTAIGAVATSGAEEAVKVQQMAVGGVGALARMSEENISRLKEIAINRIKLVNESEWGLFSESGDEQIGTFSSRKDAIKELVTSEGVIPKTGPAALEAGALAFQPVSPPDGTMVAEVSAMGAGAVQGGGSAWVQTEEEEEEGESDMKRMDKAQEAGSLMEFKQHSRQEIIEEALLRERIREAISIAKERRVKSSTNQNMLRAVIRELIAEAQAEPAPHENTGINVLEDLLKKIVPQLEPDYKKLTTDKEQRDSFRAHILNALENAIAPKEATAAQSHNNSGDSTTEPAPEESTATPIEPLEEFQKRFKQALEEIDVKIGDAADNEAGDISKFVDIDASQDQQKPEDEFGQIAGKDTTGRNIAMQSFKKVERSVQDAYALLDNEDDQKLFKDYLLTNIKLYFDKFEDELGAGGDEEPTTPEYEEEKGKAKETEAAGGEETPEGGEEEGGEPAFDLEL